MTELLYHTESYLKEFEASVINLVDTGVVLDRTAFYTGGGGQPSDSGTLTTEEREYRVNGVKRSDGNLVHQISGDLPTLGSKVSVVIDL